MNPRNPAADGDGDDVVNFALFTGDFGPGTWGESILEVVRRRDGRVSLGIAFKAGPDSPSIGCVVPLSPDDRKELARILTDNPAASVQTVRDQGVNRAIPLLPPQPSTSS